MALGPSPADSQGAPHQTLLHCPNLFNHKHALKHPVVAFRRGALLGLSDSAWTLAGVLFPAVSGVLYERLGPSTPAIASGAICLVGLAVACSVPEPMEIPQAGAAEATAAGAKAKIKMG